MKDFNFNTLEFCEAIGRNIAPTILTYHIFKALYVDTIPQLDQNKLICFVRQIFAGYNQKVEYHNEMHATDVLQMVYLFMTAGNLKNFAALNLMDILAACISAVCHDYAHDGFNNSYHVNSISEMAIRFNDKSVCENMHASEAFAVLRKPENNFLEGFERDEFKAFHLRFIGIILATDMSRHTEDL